MVKTLTSILFVLLILLAIAFSNRWWVLTHAMALVGTPELLDAQDEPGGIWFDDYYTIFRIDESTYAIGETLYWQANFNYLILGEDHAILFDAGPGVRDIRPVVRSITDLPYTFIPSHLHYDHVGNGIEFDRVALLDLPYLRNRTVNGKLSLNLYEHLGVSEGYEEPTLSIDEWWAPGSTVDLGDRSIRVLHTAGHTLNSVTLVDETAGYAFTGDFFVPGTLLEMVPYGGMGDYLEGVQTLLEFTDADTRLFGAHRDLLAEEGQTGIPETNWQDLEETRQALLDIQAGELSGRGIFPVIYTINDNIALWANPPWLQEWSKSNLTEPR